METEISCVNLPTCAKGYADGDYTKIGAMLATRNGRQIGNAVMLSNDGEEQPIYTICTDAGSLLHLNLEEIKGMFYPPIHITDIRDCPAVRAYESKNGIICKQDINNELLKSLEETRHLLALVTFLSRKAINHPDKETIHSINSVLSRAKKVCEDAKKSFES
ncbi:MAG: hypothetical protein M0P12_01665 [Paludibacteraceae bacterium]|nr:hypothetical protein [Paludibacteraceae bacterium]